MYINVIVSKLHKYSKFWNTSFDLTPPYLAIENLHHLVQDEAYRVSKVIDNEFHYEPFEGTEEYCQEMADDLTTKGEIYLDDQIGVFKEHIYRCPPNHLYFFEDSLCQDTNRGFALIRSGI